MDLSIDSDLSITDMLNSTIDSLRSLNVETDALLENLRSETDKFIDKIMIFYLRHNLTLVCLEDLMGLLNENREICDKLPTHKKQILKLFRENKDMIEVFYFIRCAKCNKIVERNSVELGQVKCCDTVLKKTETNFFVYMPLEKQIVQTVGSNWGAIKNFDTSSNDDGSISDAHDGDILKDLMKLYANDNVNILSLCVNVDGANKFNSNLVSLWPIQFCQNYLPPNIRFLPHNILVAGLMYTEEKFDFREYFLPIVAELHNLKESKIEMKIEDQTYTFQPAVTHCAVDLPAKSKLQETKQFGGYNACTYCEIPGEQVLINCKSKNKKNTKKQNNNDGENQIVDNEGNRHMKCVRYPEGDHSYPLRDEKETLKKMLAASSMVKGDVDGIKDISCLVAVEHFNIVKSFGVDYMHCILLGVQKGLTNSFCDPSNSKCKFYITKKNRELLNKRLLAIKPIREIVRKPRSLENRSKFKASEFRSILLYYFPVCLVGLLPNEYVKHVRLLSAATYILLKSTITREEIDKAEKMLHQFVAQHQKLFGIESMVMNIHLLKHVAECVRSLGPLWCHSAFSFERNNGVLLKKANGTTDVLLQVASKYCLSKAILNHPAKSKVSDKILLGRSVKIIEKSMIALNIESLKEVDLSNKPLFVHKRINLRNTIYTSLSYTLPKKTIDYFVGLQNEMIGKAKFYLDYNSEIYVVMEEFEIVDNINHILRVHPTRRNILAPANQIEQKYLYMNVGLFHYISLAPNPYENE